MSFFIQHIPLTLPYVQAGAGIVGGPKGVRLAPGVETATVKSQIFDAKRRRQYAGFELQPHEAGLQVALVDPNGAAWSYHGSWVAGGWSTPDEIRAGIATWNQPAQFLVQLHRLPDGSTPLVTHLKFGFIALGNVLAYLVNYCLPKLLSAPVSIVRWVSQPSDPVVGVNPDRIVQRDVHDFGGNLELVADYSLRVELISTDDYAIEETPILLLQMQDTSNERQLNEVDDVRLSPNDAMLLEGFAVVDQRVELTIVAQSTQDYPDYSEARAIAEQLMARLHQGYLNAPAYGQTFAIYPSKRFFSGAIPRNVRVGLLPSVSFELTLVNIPMSFNASQMSVLKEIGRAEFEMIP